MPVRIFTSVDLPAPFSPTSAVTRPGRSTRSTPSSALTPGNCLEMPRNSSNGAGRDWPASRGVIGGANCRTEDKSFAPVVDLCPSPAEREKDVSGQNTLANWSTLELS